MKIIPSLLTPSTEELYKQIIKLKPYYQHFQIDIVDGKYANNLTVQLEGIKSSINDQKELFENIIIDFDLMVIDYEKALQEVAELSTKISVDVVFVHYKSLGENPLPKHEKFRVGIALDPEDTVEKLGQKVLIQNIPALQIMTVVPGAQGSPFVSEALDKIDQLLENNYRNKIYIDGAVNDRTIPLMQQRTNRPDILCPGSYLSRAANVEERVKELEKILGN